KQVDTRCPNLKLREMHADGNATDSRVDVVAHERALPPLVKLSTSIERQWCCRDHRSSADALENRLRKRVAIHGGLVIRSKSWPNPLEIGRTGQGDARSL